MSRYAWLVCEEAREMIWLGKIISDVQSSEIHFQVQENEPNSSTTILNKVVWKFLASHIGKPIRVWSEEMMDRSVGDDFTEIGNEGDIQADDYVRSFRG